MTTWRDEWNSSHNEVGRIEKPDGIQEFTLCGHSFVSLPEVFSPAMFKDGSKYYWEAYVAEVVRIIRAMPKQTVHYLEVGCGTGCQSICVALECKNAVVDTVDMAPAAVESARINAARNGVADRYFVAQSDLLSAFEGSGKKFDIIYFDWPCVHTTEEFPESWMSGTCSDPFYSLLHRFCGDAHIERYLADGGRVFIKFSKAMGVFDAFQTIVASHKWKSVEVAKFEDVEEGVVYDYLLYELVR